MITFTFSIFFFSLSVFHKFNYLLIFINLTTVSIERHSHDILLIRNVHAKTVRFEFFLVIKEIFEMDYGFLSLRKKKDGIPNVPRPLFHKKEAMSKNICTC